MSKRLGNRTGREAKRRPNQEPDGSFNILGRMVGRTIAKIEPLSLDAVGGSPYIVMISFTDGSSMTFELYGAIRLHGSPTEKWSGAWNYLLPPP